MQLAFGVNIQEDDGGERMRDKCKSRDRVRQESGGEGREGESRERESEREDRRSSQGGGTGHVVHEFVRGSGIDDQRELARDLF